MREEAGFQRELYVSLEANRRQWEGELRAANDDVEAATATQKEWVPKLEGKVCIHVFMNVCTHVLHVICE